MIALALALSLLGDADQNALNVARDLYASAAYEDALAVLSRVPDAASSPEETRVIAQYRAFCLLALGRTAEAERVIETVISRDPSYRPTASDVSPRVRAAFSDVRRRMLPAIIQQTYASAKEAFDRKEFEAAVSRFGQLLDVMNDPDASTAVNQPGMADLRMLARGFRDLAVQAAAPPPLPVAVAPAAAAAVPAGPPPPPRIYSAADPDVVPPMTLKQVLPPFPGQLLVGRSGALEVIIDEEGLVASALMRQPVTNLYDNLAIAAAKTWRYKPATVNGIPVKYKKVIQVTVRPHA